jgi:hypothetical protein
MNMKQQAEVEARRYLGLVVGDRNVDPIWFERTLRRTTKSFAGLLSLSEQSAAKPRRSRAR